jgi:HSP20 family protein
MVLVKRDRADLMDMLRRFIGGEVDDTWMRVEEYVDDKTLVVRAELPGIDPDKDVDISVVRGTLAIRAEREERSEAKQRDSYRSEFHYGSFLREIALPAGCEEADISATYRDGVLEVRVPIGEVASPAPTRIPVTRG